VAPRAEIWHKGRAQTKTAADGRFRSATVVILSCPGTGFKPVKNTEDSDIPRFVAQLRRAGKIRTTQGVTSPRFAKIAVVVSVKKSYRPHSDNRDDLYRQVHRQIAGE
jgi:hypothetical protein